MKDEFKNLTPYEIFSKTMISVNKIKSSRDQYLELTKLYYHYYYPLPENSSYYSLEEEDQPVYFKGNQVAALLKKEMNRIDIELEFSKKFEIGKQPILEQVFKLSERTGAKIELIRILNAVYELRLIESLKGEIPSKKDFMNVMGLVFGIDLSNYASNLSQSLKNQPLEVNLKVFAEMEEIVKKNHEKHNK